MDVGSRCALTTVVPLSGVESLICRWQGHKPWRWPGRAPIRSNSGSSGTAGAQAHWALSGAKSPRLASKIGRAACRERVEISVVAGSLKKKKKIERDSATVQVYDETASIR